MDQVSPRMEVWREARLPHAVRRRFRPPRVGVRNDHLSRTAILVEESCVEADVFLDPLTYVNAQPILTQQVAQTIAVDQLYRRRSIAHCFSLGVSSEGAGRNQQAFLTTSRHSSPEVSDDVRRDHTLVALALEIDGKRDQRDAVGPGAIDSTVSALSRDCHVDEPGFAQDALR